MNKMESLFNHQTIMQPPPIWLMRQAGRYLPEYRKERMKSKHFLELCYNPDFAVEVALQPIRRYDLDASILFSDILVIPDALGREVRFTQGEGPRLTPLKSLNEIDQMILRKDQVNAYLEPVFIILKLLRNSLPKDCALIGFSGAPWTLACYMLAGGAHPNFPSARLMAYQHPEFLQKLIDLLSEVIADYLIMQAKSGATILQLFDSWAGLLDANAFDQFIIKPTTKIIKSIRNAGITCPIIGFPRGAGTLYLDYVQATKVDAISLDPAVSLKYARENLQKYAVLQGNLEPLRLQGNKKLWQKEVDFILNNIGKEKFIFNLGHGIDKETDPEAVKDLVQYIREFDYMKL